MDITLIQVPYDSGHYARRMGRGPVHLIQGGLETMLEQAGHDVRVLELRLDEGFLTEVGTALETQRLVAECVAAEIGEERLPLILSGNCATGVGAMAGAGATSTGVVWLDSHGDFNTPETSHSGFFDGMVLAMLIGDCWTAAAADVPGFEPVPESHILTVGMRDLDTAEEVRLDASEIRRIGIEAIRTAGTSAALEDGLTALAAQVDSVYLHIDLDVLDPEVARINSYQAPNGLTVDQVIEVIEVIAEHLPLRAAALTAFDPQLDESGSGGDGALEIATALANSAGNRTTR